MSAALTLDKNLNYSGNFSSSVLHIPYNSFPYQKSQCKVQIIIVTPLELKMACGESNEINGEQNVLCLTAEKKIVCF